eukprot:165408_1
MSDAADDAAVGILLLFCVVGVMMLIDSCCNNRGKRTREPTEYSISAEASRVGPTRPPRSVRGDYHRSSYSSAPLWCSDVQQSSNRDGIGYGQYCNREVVGSRQFSAGHTTFARHNIRSPVVSIKNTAQMNSTREVRVSTTSRQRVSAPAASRRQVSAPAAFRRQVSAPTASRQQVSAPAASRRQVSVPTASK